MMKRKGLGAAVAVALVFICGVRTAAAQQEQPYVAGQIIVRMAQATTVNQASGVANAVGMVLVRPLKRAGLFLFSLPDPGVGNEPIVTQEKLNQLRQHPLVHEAFLNYVMHKFQIPNDPMFGPATNRQWNLFQIGLPGPAGAWAVHKGLAGINVVDIDDWFDIDHLDFRDTSGQTRMLTGYDPITGGTNVRPPYPPGNFSHGTMTASVIVAGTDNGLDMAGVTWEGVKLAPVAADGLAFALVFDCYQWVIDYNRNPANRPFVALNMSYGHFAGEIPTEKQFLGDIANLGTIPVAASGNSRPSPAGWPASYSSVVSVAATRYAGGIKGVPASYSSPGSLDGRSKVDIAAPSADFTADVICLLYGGGTTTGGGTSYSCPTAVGAIALLASAGMRKENIVAALKQTGVVAPGQPKPNLDVGWGEIDVAAAAALVVPMIEPVSPATDNAIFAYQTVPFEFRMFRVRQTGPAPTITVAKADMSYSYVLDPSNYSFQVDSLDPRIITIKGKARLSEAGSLDEGDWKIIVEGTEMAPGSATITGERSVRVRYKVIASGINMSSIPYSIMGDSSPPGGRKPESFYGADVVMHRWVPDGGGQYYMYDPGLPNTQFAGFTPSNLEVMKTTQSGSTIIETPQNGPWGNGYWTQTTSNSVMNFELGPEDPVINYKIKMKPGWNQFGAPFEFPVDWNTCLIQRLPSLEIMTIDQAATARVIKPQLFRFELGLGGVKSYTWASPPRGQLIPFESHWLFVYEECWLIVQPTPSGFGTATNRAPSIRGQGWLRQLKVSSGKTEDVANYFGATKDMNPVYDRVSEPPANPSGISMWFTASDGGRLAQDLRELSAGREEFQVTVRPSEPNADVTLTWSEIVPSLKRQKVTMKDMVTGRVVTMGTGGSYSFRSDEALTPRTFVITVQPDAVGRLVIGAVRVGGGTRGGTGNFTIQYTLSAEADVTIRVLGTNGKTIANLESRTRAPGTNSVVWNGRDMRGASVAPGVYIVEITAETGDGERARTTTPITITR